MKLITFVVPCYNSEHFLEKCVNSLLTPLAHGWSGNDFEVLIVDDGSIDATAEMCDAIQNESKEVVRVIHQKNLGHGGAINTALVYAEGVYFKVVDSDDWLDAKALEKVMCTIRSFIMKGQEIDMLVTNYVYEHIKTGKSKPMRYRTIFPQDKITLWNKTGIFLPSQYLLMHSLILKTQLLRKMDLVLPEHSFYVDNVFAFLPLLNVKSIYYINVDLYRYQIGHELQSVCETTMIQRVDQQINITHILVDSVDLKQLSKVNPRLAWYLKGYISMMVSVCSILLFIRNTSESLEKYHNLVNYLRRKPALFRHLTLRIPSCFTLIPGAGARMLCKIIYIFTKKLYQFN
jgi:glycosyltransferase involved in cell wall biosynthesis